MSEQRGDASFLIQNRENLAYIRDPGETRMRQDKAQGAGTLARVYCRQG